NAGHHSDVTEAAQSRSFHLSRGRGIMNQIDLRGRVAAITGGARGIGYAIAERFVQSGAKEALWDLAGAESSASRLQGAIGLAMDVTKQQSVAGAVAA